MGPSGAMKMSAVLAILLAAGSAGADSSAPLRGINLLALVKVPQDSVSGHWEFQGKTLVTPSLAFGRVQVPYVPPDEYDLLAVVERKGKGNSLNLGLSSGGRQFSVILDGGNDPMSGLDLVDGKGFYGNETTVKGRLIADNSCARVFCRVRKGAVAVWVNDRKVVDWSGDFARLSLFGGWKTPNDRALFLGTWEGSVNHFHRLELTPFKGTGKALR